jgi:hypothetical protein
VLTRDQVVAKPLSAATSAAHRRQHRGAAGSDTSAPGTAVEISRTLSATVGLPRRRTPWSELTSSVDNRGATGSDDKDNRNAEAYSRHQHRAASSRSLVAANCPRRHRKNHHSCHGQPSLKPSSRLRATQQQMSSTSWHSPIFYGAPYSVQTGNRCADNLQTVRCSDQTKIFKLQMGQILTDKSVSKCHVT